MVATLNLDFLRPLESQEQSLYFDWLEYVSVDGEPMRQHFYAVPNGGSRHPAEGARLKLQGVTAGVGDINGDVPAGPYHGLRIEMKRRGGRKPTPDQCAHLELRRRMGYCSRVCFGFDEARRETLHYLALRGVVVDRWAT